MGAHALVRDRSQHGTAAAGLPIPIREYGQDAGDQDGEARSGGQGVAQLAHARAEVARVQLDGRLDQEVAHRIRPVAEDLDPARESFDTGKNEPVVVPASVGAKQVQDRVCGL